MAALVQGTQRIEVVVRKENLDAATAGANEQAPEEAGSNAGEQAQGSGGGQSGFFGARGKNFARINATKVLALGIMAGRLALNYSAGGVAYRNGDAALQDAVQRNYEMAEEGVTLISSIGIGATYGSAGGAAGAIIGATIGAISAGVSLIVKYAGKFRDYDAKMFKEENAIEYKRARAQVSLTTGRLR